MLPLNTGSWEGDIRIWKLDSKLKSFSLIGSIPASGVVNSLQLISPTKEFLENAPWATPTPITAADHSISLVPEATNVLVKRKTTGGSPLLLVAGLGQEHRLGRWLTVKEGVVNGALVVALSPRTLA
jgi:ribosomal RNA-processing protein 9